jgi:hypothetical protein
MEYVDGNINVFVHVSVRAQVRVSHEELVAIAIVLAVNQHFIGEAAFVCHVILGGLVRKRGLTFIP